MSMLRNMFLFFLITQAPDLSCTDRLLSSEQGILSDAISGLRPYAQITIRKAAAELQKIHAYNPQFDGHNGHDVHNHDLDMGTYFLAFKVFLEKKYGQFPPELQFAVTQFMEKDGLRFAEIYAFWMGYEVDLQPFYDDTLMDIYALSEHDWKELVRRIRFTDSLTAAVLARRQERVCGARLCLVAASMILIGLLVFNGFYQG